MNLPIKHQQQYERRQILRWNIGFLLEAEEDDNDDETWDDVITLDGKETEDRHLDHGLYYYYFFIRIVPELHHALFR